MCLAIFKGFAACKPCLCLLVIECCQHGSNAVISLIPLFYSAKKLASDSQQKIDGKHRFFVIRGAITAYRASVADIINNKQRRFADDKPNRNHN